MHEPQDGHRYEHKHRIAIDGENLDEKQIGRYRSGPYDHVQTGGHNPPVGDYDKRRHGHFVKVRLQLSVRGAVAAQKRVHIARYGYGEHERGAYPKRSVQVRIGSNLVEQKILIERRHHGARHARQYVRRVHVKILLIILYLPYGILLLV